tara:strand:- start:1106 stop:1294 length:189 start_codon:yes stop_codon:yes gene_type:complete
MKAIKSCPDCGKTKDVKEFGVVDGKRGKTCTECKLGVSEEFLKEIEDMDDFTPINEIDFDDI